MFLVCTSGLHHQTSMLSLHCVWSTIITFLVKLLQWLSKTEGANFYQLFAMVPVLHSAGLIIYTSLYNPHYCPRREVKQSFSVYSWENKSSEILGTLPFSTTNIYTDLVWNVFSPTVLPCQFRYTVILPLLALKRKSRKQRPFAHLEGYYS